MNGDDFTVLEGGSAGQQDNGTAYGTGESTHRETAADRRARPSFYEIAQGAADKFGVCRRPIPMMVVDVVTGNTEYVAAPCKSTLESDCPACAARARLLRIQQCREGWHVETEPVDITLEPTEQQTELLTRRADLVADYQAGKQAGDEEVMAAARAEIAELDAELRATGIRQSLPPLEPAPKPKRKRSTKRRQDVPDLPRRKVAKTTIGGLFAGKYRYSMFVTLTMPSYGRINAGGAKDVQGKVCSDGSPVDPDTYDYTQAARDIIGFPALFDRWIQNLRRCLGYDVQYFATVEPQRRGAPHIHIALRTAIPHKVIRQVTEATYRHLWWPHFDQPRYESGHMPVWDFDEKMNTFVDPGTGQRLPSFDEVMAVMDTVDELEPAHTIRFGAQIDSKGILGGTEEAGRHIGYLTKYLVKSIGEIVEPQSQRAADHYTRLHQELQVTPCSPNCPVWLRYGIVPRKATHKTQPGRCKGKAHRRNTLGIRGRRVLVSRRWTGKTLPDHKADRAEFVRQLLAEAGIEKPDTSRYQVMPVEPGDPQAPPRDHLILAAIAQRSTWANQWAQAKAAQAERQAAQEDSAMPTAA
ncbi:MULTISPECIES: helitron helicase-like domain-containing protein [unclassified Nocardia]|uniref:helitron helicase-like domain-containing protein n=1 Tax=unclassified Nocardia TaxID=2637762 RepID=UPI001CE3C525|nr:MULTISPECIES: helitron helicase-like domain-containing protein [unclassified Nocardia]